MQPSEALIDEQIDAIADAHRWYTREGRRAMIRAALAAAPAAEPAPISPMAKMAQALRDKAADEKAAFDARVQSGEWGPMPDAGTEADHVAEIEGDDAVRSLAWNKNVGAFEYQVGTKLYATPPAPQAAPVQGAIAAVLRAMVKNYSGGHDWDQRDAEACLRAADELDRLATAPPAPQAAPVQAQGALSVQELGELKVIARVLRSESSKCKGAYEVIQDMAEQLGVIEARHRYNIGATHPAQPAEQAGEDAIRALIAEHGRLLDDNEYAYFELAYTRRTGWMAWITDKPLAYVVESPDRKIIAQGQGDTPDDACADAARALRGGKGEG